MQYVKVAAVELNQTPLDWAGNERRIREALDEARSQGASLVCLPELCITGYGCEDAFHSMDLRERAWRMLRHLLPATRGMVVSLGLPVAYRNALFNVAALAVDGRLVGLVAKQHLAGDGLHYEPRWFRPWPAGVRVELDRDGERIPMGDLYFSVGGIRLGFEICEDAWVAQRPGARLSLAGIDVILNPSASHFEFGKLLTRRRFVVEGSRAFGVTYLYANLLGNEAGRAIYDGGALIATSGKLVAAGPRFSFAEWRVTCATVDIDQTRTEQARRASFQPDVRADAGACVSVPFSYPRLAPVVEPPPAPSWEDGPHVKEEEFTRAVSLAMHDYARKSRSAGFVVSMSGGADSAACACLVALMAQLAEKELGQEAFLARWPASVRRAQNSPIRALLTTAYQATANSGEVTRRAAREVAEALGAEHHELDVEVLRREVVSMVSRALGRELSWETDDLALQNVQARIRAPGVWMLANLKGALLMATSNRSEAAVGYATMDGDTSGGLSPVAGIDKAFLRRWLRWLETTGPDGLSPIPALAVVNDQAPTAELRPPSQHQTDEADLMPYDVLDVIERVAVRDKLSPLEAWQRTRPLFPQHDPKTLAGWVERFFRLWCRNQWKRERYAPSFHLDDENLDPKTWCRFPILSGGYETEIAELREAAGLDG